MLTYYSIHSYMNIVYIHTHDSGRYLEPYGYGIPTPNLMGFAKQSTLFRNCHCAGPTCSASRAALLTGAWPHVNGMTGLAHRGDFALKDYNMHMARYFKSQGYETVLSGIQHEAMKVETIGYDRVLNDTSMSVHISDVVKTDMDAAQRAKDYMLERNARKGNFFLSVGFFSTHLPFMTIGDVAEDYVMPPHVLHDCKETRKDMAGFIHSASIADRCVGIVLDGIKEAGFEDNTVVFFTTDHGVAFPHMKCTLYDTGTGVSLIMRYPGNPTAGTSTDALVSHIDIFPTLCDLCGLDKPKWLQGMSLESVLRGDTEKANSQIHSEVTYHAAYEPMRSIRTERYKLIKRYDWHLEYVPSNTDNCNSKQFLIENGFMDNRVMQREMLFDLYFDPVERENLVGNSAYLDVYNDLSSRLHKWMEDTNDPLISVTHRVPAPKGAKINKLSCIHPEYNEFE